MFPCSPGVPGRPLGPSAPGPPVARDPVSPCRNIHIMASSITLHVSVNQHQRRTGCPCLPLNPLIPGNPGSP